MKSLAFHRDFRRFSGGHLKVWDYFQHTKASGIFEPVMYLIADSLRDASNPWVANGERISEGWNPREADALFLAGEDWLAVPDACDTPVVNLIQGLRHASPEDPRRAFLRRPATRLCVSQQVADAILATGLVNGPVVTIPAGVDTASFPAPTAPRDIPVLVAGLKKPALAKSLSEILSSHGVEHVCLTEMLPRADFLGLLSRARVTVFLPQTEEGFYLPALEGMAMETLVVCPDCIGNRSFCVDRTTCLVPEYATVPLVAACLAALQMGRQDIDRLQRNGRLQAESHALSMERRRYLEVLHSLVA